MSGFRAGQCEPLKGPLFATKVGSFAPDGAGGKGGVRLGINALGLLRELQPLACHLFTQAVVLESTPPVECSKRRLIYRGRFISRREAPAEGRAAYRRPGPPRLAERPMGGRDEAYANSWSHLLLPQLDCRHACQTRKRENIGARNARQTPRSGLPRSFISCGSIHCNHDAKIKCRPSAQRDAHPAAQRAQVALAVAAAVPMCGLTGRLTQPPAFLKDSDSTPVTEDRRSACWRTNRGDRLS
jgi:hypothetical protein